MDICEFLHNLHYETDKSKPPEWEIDWDDAPLPYKLYRGLPAFRLSADIPLTLGTPVPGSKPGLREFGHFLWYACGISQVSRQAIPPGTPPEAAGPEEICRRIIPSGGGMYPSEVYAYLKFPELPSGVYHYDTAHHRLVLLREGIFDTYLDDALGGRCTTAAYDGAIFVTTMFWKNYFKYCDFSYRLQGLDAGVLIGQLLEAGRGFGFTASVYFQFLDRAVNHLLGISEQEESVYAAIPFAADSGGEAEEQRGGAKRFRPVEAAELVGELPALRHDHFVRSRRVKDYSHLIEVNEAAIQHASGDYRLYSDQPAPSDDTRPFPVPLPQLERKASNLAAISRKRYSPETDFVLQGISIEQLASLLRESVSAPCVRIDLDDSPQSYSPRIQLYGCFYGVEGMEDGAYRYDVGTHSLVHVRQGDHRAWLQYGMTFHNVNLFQVPLCFHVAGDRNHYRKEWGVRGYRIQQMEAGMLVQRLLLAAAAAGLGGRPLLGYDVAAIDDLYRLPASGQTALIQIPIGHYRYRSRYEGALHS